MNVWKEGENVFKLKFAFFFLTIFLIIFFPGLNVTYARQETSSDELTPEEIQKEYYYSIIDQEGKVITVTGRRLFVGDEYLTADNRLYRVYKVEKYTAQARYLKMVEPADQFVMAKGSAVSFAGDASRGAIAVFHTHNAESYVPTDGTESIYGRGGIHDVGDAFKKALEEKGIRAIHSEQMHLPHDRGAYLRARETVLSLMEEHPEAIFDIHRDAAPPETYLEKVDSSLVAQIQFVVGRQNPNMDINRQFAYDLKAYADRMYANLVRGVLLNNGNYNQDLYPTMLLLEVGSHLTEKELAEESVIKFSDVVAYYFYGPEALKGKRDKKQTAAAARSAARVLTVAAAGLLFFFFINNPASLSRIRGIIGEKLSQGKEGFSRILVEGYELLLAASAKIREEIGRLRQRLKS